MGGAHSKYNEVFETVLADFQATVEPLMHKIPQYTHFSEMIDIIRDKKDSIIEEGMRDIPNLDESNKEYLATKFKTRIYQVVGLDRYAIDKYLKTNNTKFGFASSTDVISLDDILNYHNGVQHSNFGSKRGRRPRRRSEKQKKPKSGRKHRRA